MDFGFDLLNRTRVEETARTLMDYLEDMQLGDYQDLDPLAPLVALALLYHLVNVFLTLRTVKRPISAAIKVAGLAATVFGAARLYTPFQVALGYLKSKGLDLYLEGFSVQQTYSLLWVYPNLANLFLAAVVLVLSVCGFAARVVGCLVCA